MVARNDGEHYGRLVLYRFPKQSLVYGPAQIVNQINQDTTSRARSRCGTRADPELPRPFLRLELVQRRPYGGRADPLGAAVHIFDAAAPHHPVFARANPDAPDVLAHVPVLLPPTPGVTLRRVGQLLVRKHRALQSQEDAQSTLKVIGRDGHASSLFRSTKLRKWSGSLRFCNSR